MRLTLIFKVNCCSEIVSVTCFEILVLETVGMNTEIKSVARVQAEAASDVNEATTP